GIEARDGDRDELAVSVDHPARARADAGPDDGVGPLGAGLERQRLEHRRPRVGRTEQRDEEERERDAEARHLLPPQFVCRLSARRSMPRKAWWACPSRFVSPRAS